MKSGVSDLSIGVRITYSIKLIPTLLLRIPQNPTPWESSGLIAARWVSSKRYKYDICAIRSHRLGIPSPPLSSVPCRMRQTAEGTYEQAGEPRVAPYASWSLTFEAEMLYVVMQFVKITCAAHRLPSQWWERTSSSPATTSTSSHCGAGNGLDNE